MSLKLWGAVFVVAGCGGVGFAQTVHYRKTEQAFRQLLAAMDYMECELQYRMTPLPELSRKTGEIASGVVGKVFSGLSEELEHQIAPDVRSCMNAVLDRVSELPDPVEHVLRELAKNLGQFDLDGQLRGLEHAGRSCQKALEHLEANRDVRLRSYQTLGLCAGAALAILLI